MSDTEKAKAEKPKSVLTIKKPTDTPSNSMLPGDEAVMGPSPSADPNHKDFVALTGGKPRFHFVGDGKESYSGVPMRDLSSEEFEHLSVDQQFQVVNGHVVRNDDDGEPVVEKLYDTSPRKKKG